MIFEKQVLNIYKGMMFTRQDDTETVFYFSAEDFKDLHAEPYSFKAGAGHTLNGYIYNYDDPRPNRLIVFDHGFGGGHRAYMKEIERLCRSGYTVLSYDHTGCMESEGDNPGGLSTSLSDLNDCIRAIKKDERFKEFDISVMGHSWGAFSTLNISALHPEISHVVAMCGFVCVEEMIKTFFSGILKGYRGAVFSLEKESNPKFAEYNAVDSLKKSEVKALLIYSENDHLCQKVHYDILHEALADREKISFILVKDKGHNPNYTKDAVALLSEFTKARTRLLKKKNLSEEEKARFVAGFDWHKMTEQDESLWEKILAHLEK